MENRVKVGIRIRPLSTKEIEEGTNVVIAPSGNQGIRVQIPTRSNKFDYDWVFESITEQQVIYDKIASPLIENIFQGFNATIFAYGQTGSGKTYTMGSGSNKDGIIYRSIESIFNRIRDRSAQSDCGYSYSVSLSYLEIYKEECFDLLSDNSSSRTRLDLRENSQGGTYVDGLSQWPIASPERAAQLLNQAAEGRATGKTAMNAQSSRSHSLCSISVRMTPRDGSGDTIVSKLHLVDLAGSERAKKTLATGDIFNEGISINRGLLALGNVVAALAAKSFASSSNLDSNDKGDASQRHIHIPYRESKLTRLLKDSLGGNGMTVLLACVSPADTNFDETLNTLKFGTRALSVINSAQVNREESISAKHSGDNDLRQEVVDLKSQLKTLQLKCDLMTAQQLLQSQNNVSHEKAQLSNPSKVPDDTATLSAGILMLSSSFRSVLRQNFEEDVELDDEELDCIGAQVSHLKNQIAPSEATASEELLGIDLGMPPILRLIESILCLEDSVKQGLNGDDSDEAQVGPNAVSRGNAQSVSQDSAGTESFVTRNTSAAHDKEIEIANMQSLTLTFEDSIAKLRFDISELECQKQVLLNEQSRCQQEAKLAGSKSNHVPVATSARDAKLKKELQEKSELLEAKLSQLKLKEQECARIALQKEKAIVELSKLQASLYDATQQKGTLARKLRDQTVAHEQDKKLIRLQEAQCRRRELLAQCKVAKMEKQLLQKEKVWKGQLDAKRREESQLRATIQKQQSASRHRDQIALVVSAKKHLSGKTAEIEDAEDELVPPNSNRIEFFESWIEKETLRQRKLLKLRAELKEAMKLRAAVAKEIATHNDTGSTQNLNTNLENTSEQIKELSARISTIQGEILNTEFSSDKKKFGGVVSLKEAKSLISLLFARMVSTPDPHVSSSSENSYRRKRKSATPGRSEIKRLEPYSIAEVTTAEPENKDFVQSTSSHLDTVSNCGGQVQRAGTSVTFSSGSQEFKKSAKPFSTTSKGLLGVQKAASKSIDFPGRGPTVARIRPPIFAPKAIADRRDGNAHSTSSKQQRPAQMPSNRPTGNVQIQSRVQGPAHRPGLPKSLAPGDKKITATCDQPRSVGLANIAKKMSTLSQSLGAVIQGGLLCGKEQGSSSEKVTDSSAELTVPDAAAETNNALIEENSDAEFDDEEDPSYDDYSESDNEWYESDDLDESFYPDEEDEIENSTDDDSVFRAKRARSRRVTKSSGVNNGRSSNGSLSESDARSSIGSATTNTTSLSASSDLSAGSSLVSEDSNKRKRSVNHETISVGDESDFSTSASDDGSDGSDSDALSAKKLSKKRKVAATKTQPRVKRSDLQVAKEVLDEISATIAAKPLVKHTVKELKALLQLCGSTVTGVKEELIKRLELVLMQHDGRTQPIDDVLEVDN